MEIEQKKHIFIGFGLLLIGFTLGLLVNSPASSDTPIEETEEVQEMHLVAYPGRSINYSQRFRDLNDKHLAAAKKIGLSPSPANREEAKQMKRQLREVTSCDNYVIDELTYSIPYLVPTAAARLDAIGAEFQDILSRNNLPSYRFRVTSILRTQDDIRRLQRTNSNSTAHSAHNYGTTFDLAYMHFEKTSKSNDYMTDDNLKLVLAQVLLNQQREGHIYVKYEYKQSCFHITVRN